MLNLSIRFLSTFLFLHPLIFTTNILANQEIRSKSADINSELLKDYFSKKEVGTEYILGVGDSILILFNEDSIPNKPYKISSDGTIYTERLKRIYVKGLTINELTTILNKEYLKYFINPNISVEIIQYRPVRIYIDGEVISPGSYLLGGKEIINNAPIDLNALTNLNNFLTTPNSEFNREPSREMMPTLFDAIQSAQGISLYSDLTNIDIVRKDSISNGGGKIKTTINLLKFLEDGDSNQNIILRDGDVITIKKSDIPLNDQFRKAIKTNLQGRFNKVFISGRVENPGAKIINKAATLNDLIILSGGTKSLSGKIYFVRFNSDGTLTRKIIKYNRNAKLNPKNNPVLITGDIVMVDSNVLLKGSNAISEVTAPFVGIFSSYNFFKIFFN